MGLFDVKSVAIVGASPKEEKVGNIILNNFLKIFKGKIFAVNPNYKEISGIPCYPSVKDIPEDVDMVVIAIPAKSVPQVIKDSVEKGVKLAIIISAGFSETGEEGKKLEEEIINIAKGKLRIIGPNGLGVYDPYNGIDTFFVREEKVPRPPKGKIAILSQSGAIALALMEWLALHNIGVSKIISYGNKIDIDEIDLLYELKDDPNTKCVFMYIEGLKEKRGREFLKAAEEFIKARKIIVALKAGKTKRGQSAVSSHTASLAGDYEVYEFAFKEVGIIEAKNMEDLLIYLRTISYFI